MLTYPFLVFQHVPWPCTWAWCQLCQAISVQSIQSVDTQCALLPIHTPAPHQSPVPRCPRALSLARPFCERVPGVLHSPELHSAHPSLWSCCHSTTHKDKASISCLQRVPGRWWAAVVCFWLLARLRAGQCWRLSNLTSRTAFARFRRLVSSEGGHTQGWRRSTAGYLMIDWTQLNSLAKTVLTSLQPMIASSLYTHPKD